MSRPSTTSLALLSLFWALAVRARNDWSVPCTSGWCSWDMPEGDSIGSVILTSSSSALSDLTPAAGWHILDCDPTSLEPQQVRIVCESSDLDAAGCAAIYEGQVENTIVRLPKSCGSGPFGRLVRVWPSGNQDVPEATFNKMRKRQKGEEIGIVQEAIIDFDFGAIPVKGQTPVTMVATGSNHPDVPLQEVEEVARRAFGSQKMRRGLEARNVFNQFLDALKNLNTASQGSETTAPFTFKQNFPIVTQSISCPQTDTTPAFDAGFDMNVDVDIAAQVTYGFVVAGEIVPPRIIEMGIISSFTGNAGATFNLNGQAKATVDLGSIELARVPLSPLQIPGLVNVGPSASVTLTGAASVGVTGNLVVGTALNIPRVEMRFPPKHGASTSDPIVSLDAPLKLAVAPEVGVKGTGSIEAHLIPQINLGMDLINGFAKAEVFLALDTSGTVKMDFEAGAVGGANADSSGATGAGGLAGAQGCLDVDAGIALKVGATGSVPGVFDQSTAFDIASQSFDIFNRCFGAGARRRDLFSLPAVLGVQKRQTSASATLQCPGTVGTAASLFEGLVKAA